jgi:TRAP transporter TAXI family solute receptor
MRHRCSWSGWAARCAAAVLAWSVAGAAGAQSFHPEVERANRATIGIMSGAAGGTYVQIAQNLADALDTPGQLRVIAMLGKGSMQNILDLLYLRGVDLAIVQSDVLQFIKDNAMVENVDKISYIAKLYDEEVHVVARSDIRSLKDLTGQKVHIGDVGSGTAMTANIIFDALDIGIEPVAMANSQAIAALKAGELAAAVFVAGKPASILRELDASTGLRLIDIETDKGLDHAYLSGEFSHEDYPDLVPEGAVVRTVAVGAVLAVYDWSRNSDRYDRTAHFVQEFFGSLDELRTPAYHPKWYTVDLTAELPGWRRFAAAQEQLATTAAAQR